MLKSEAVQVEWGDEGEGSQKLGKFFSAKEVKIIRVSAESTGRVNIDCS
jgi:hypothetical protein